MRRLGSRRHRANVGVKSRHGRLLVELLEGRQLLSTITVNTVDDDVTPDTTLSLREAIEVANGTLPTSSLSTEELAQISGDVNQLPNTIAFGITGTGLHTIAPGSALPTLIRPVIIDGTTQPRVGTTPTIEINGSSAGLSVDGLVVGAGAASSTIKGLVINRFSGNGIKLDGTNGATVTGNVIGADPTGSPGRPNSGSGVLISSSSNNLIGGTVSGAGNTIAFNLQDGIHVASGSGNALQRNSITDNVLLGIRLDAGANAGILAPALASSITNAGVTTVRGTFNGAADTLYSFDLYSNPNLSSATTAQGRFYAGTQTVKTNAQGRADLVLTTSAPVALNQFLVVTATDPSNNTSAFSNPVLNSVPIADVRITGTAAPSPVAQNGYLTYTYTVTNPGPAPATVTFTDALPTSLSFVQATTTKGTISQTSNVVTGALGVMQPGTVATVTIRVVPLTVGTITNTASVTAPEDTNTVNNSISISTPVQQGSTSSSPPWRRRIRWSSGAGPPSSIWSRTRDRPRPRTRP